MASTSTIAVGNADISLEDWSQKMNLDDMLRAAALVTTDGTLAHTKVGMESFADVVHKRTGINQRLITKVLQNVDRFFIRNSYVDSNARISDEALSLAPTVSRPYVAKYIIDRPLKELSQDAVISLATECLENVSTARINSTCREIAAILGAKDARGSTFETSRGDPANAMSVYEAVGARAYGHYSNFNVGIDELSASMEAFGSSIDALNINNRLAIAVAILRNFSSTIDKLFIRKTDDTNTVVMVIPSPVIFSLEMMNNHRADVRNNPTTEVPLINIHSEPGIVNTDPQAVMPNMNPVNDTGRVKFLDATSVPGKISLNAIGQLMNLSDLTANKNRYGFENTNHTDSIAEGGLVSQINLKAVYKDPEGKKADVVEVYPIQVGTMPGARYIMTANNSDSGDTIVTITDQPYPLTSQSQTVTGDETNIFKVLGKANIVLRVNFTSNLRLKYCDIDGNGGVAVTVVPAAGVSADGAASDIEAASALLENVEFSIPSFIPELFFNEENLRKTTISTRINWLQRSFQIPQGKNFTTDTALDQGKEEAPIEAIQTAMSVGNSDRGMAVIESKLQETADIIASAKLNPEIYRETRLQNMSYAGTLCRPYVLRAVANYGELNVAVMRESERLTDKHAKITQMFLNGLANVTTRSLYCVNLNPGERTVFKALMHSVLADLLFSIPSYHEALADAVPKANGADYSFMLPNGYRIDIVKTNFHNWQNQIAVMPVREDDPADILSFATIRDRGVFAGTVPGGVYQGSTVIRDVVNSREFVLVTNPIGMIMNVQNVDIDMGTVDVVDTI